MGVTSLSRCRHLKASDLLLSFLQYAVETPGVTIMRQTNRFFFCGHTSGKVSLRDLRSFKVEHEFDAFSGSLSDFDVHGNLLAACGFSSRLTGLACDRFLKVYDLRMMRAITPLQVHVDPAFLRFIPTYTSRLAIISQSGRTGAALGRTGAERW